MKLQCLTVCSLLALLTPAVLAAPTRQSKPGGRTSPTGGQIVVKLHPSHDTATTLHSLISRHGRLFVSAPRSHSYRILLSSGVSIDSAIRSIRTNPAVASVKPYNAPKPVLSLPADLNSAQRLRGLIARLEQNSSGRMGTYVMQPSNGTAPISGKLGKALNSSGSGVPGYIHAYRYWLEQRAYPGDSIPRDAYAKAIAHRSRMKPARIGRQGGGIGLESLDGQWEFMGPVNLDVPYTIYWGPAPVAGRINATAFDPNNPGTYYVAAAGGGVWKSTDSGANWTPIGDKWPFLQTSAIAVDSKNSNTIWVGTGDYDGGGIYAFGLMKSTDAGATWTNLAATEIDGAAVSGILIDPDNSNIVTVTTGRGDGPGKVLRTTNGGVSWSQPIAVTTNWQDIAISVSHKLGLRYMFAIGDGGQLWRSSDRGQTWAQIPSPVGFYGNLATSTLDWGSLYVSGGGNQRVFKSIDAGDTWFDITNGIVETDPPSIWTQSWYDNHVSVTLGRDTSGFFNDNVYVGLIDLWQQSDQFLPFSSVGLTTTANALTHNDQHAMSFNPSNPNEALVGNDGGVYRYTFDTTTRKSEFVTLNKNLGITQFYRASWHPTDPNIALGGTQDNATPAAQGDLTNWNNVGGGDGGFCAINANNPSIQYATSQFGVVYRTANSWTNTANITPDTSAGDIDDNLPFVTCIALDPNRPDILYYGTNYLYRYNGSTGVWDNRISNKVLAPGGVVSYIAVAKGSPFRLYVGTSDGLVWFSADAVNFVQINSGQPALPNRSITSIDVNPNDTEDFLVTLSGFGTGHVFRCLDPRAVPRVYTDVSGTGANKLPDVPVNAVTRDPVSPGDSWYAATDVGVFMTTDGGSNWFNATESLGLPNVACNDIKSVPGTGYVNVATYGRGMWRAKLSSQTVPQVDTLTLNPPVVCQGETSVGTIKLKVPVANGGTVDVTSSDPSAASVPAKVTFGPGQDTATFTIQSFAVAAPKFVTIKATNAGSASASAILTVTALAPANVAVNSNPGCAGTLAVGSVTLTCPPAAGTTVTLSSSNPSIATVPASVNVAPGTKVATFPVGIPAASAGKSVIISATVGGVTKTVTLDVTTWLNAIFINPVSVCGGSLATGSVTLNCPAPVGGVTVSLSSGNTAVATVPASIVIGEGKTSGLFPISSKAVAANTSVTVTATAFGVSKTASLAVKTNAPVKLTFVPSSTRGGNTSTGTVVISCPAPAGGAVVSLTSSLPGVAAVPASFTIPAGTTQRNFTVTTSVVSVGTTVEITATYNGKFIKGTLTVLPQLYPNNHTFRPNPACANSFSVGTVTLNAAAPAGGVTVALGSSNTTVATVPASVFIPGGALSANYTVTTKDVPIETAVTISATYAGVNKPGTLKIKASQLTSCVITPANVKGGTNVTLTINLSCPAGANGTLVTLKSNNTAALSPPASVLVPAGKSAANFLIGTNQVEATTQATLTATANGISRSATVTVVP
jgi:photosystem II stability/assembly factor-like uncharacterized protein